MSRRGSNGCVALACALLVLGCQSASPKPEPASIEAPKVPVAPSPQAGVELPALRGRVNDYADLLTPEQEHELSAVYASLEEGVGCQMAVLTVESLPSPSIDDFSLAVANRWALGRSGIDDGLLITLAFKEKQWRIEVGYGLELIIPDDVAQQIGQRMSPAFAAGNFFKGLEQGSRELIELIQQNPGLVGKRAR